MPGPKELCRQVDKASSRVRLAKAQRETRVCVSFGSGHIPKIEQACYQRDRTTTAGETAG